MNPDTQATITAVLSAHRMAVTLGGRGMQQASWWWMCTCGERGPSHFDTVATGQRLAAKDGDAHVAAAITAALDASRDDTATLTDDGPHWCPQCPEKAWRVDLNCCGRDDGAYFFETWGAANEFRDGYCSGAGVDPHGYSGDGFSGHQRSGVITQSAARARVPEAEAQDEAGLRERIEGLLTNDATGREVEALIHEWAAATQTATINRWAAASRLRRALSADRAHAADLRAALGGGE